MDEHIHQANCIKEAIKYVKTKNILIIEHDCMLENYIDIRGIVNLITKYPHKYKHILLYHEKNIYDEFGNLYSSITNPNRQYVENVPLIMTKVWSIRPHFAPTQYYRDFILKFVSSKARVYLEDLIFSIASYRYQLDPNSHNEFGTYIYAPESGCMRCHQHLDGRREDKKVDMIWKYDGEIPLGAPLM